MWHEDAMSRASMSMTPPSRRRCGGEDAQAVGLGAGQEAQGIRRRQMTCKETSSPGSTESTTF